MNSAGNDGDNYDDKDCDLHHQLAFGRLLLLLLFVLLHVDVINWKHLPRYWPFVRGIHRSPVNSPHKGQWRGALMFSLICVWINNWVNNREAGDLRRYRAHYDVIAMGDDDHDDCDCGAVGVTLFVVAATTTNAGAMNDDDNDDDVDKGNLDYDDDDDTVC